MKARSGFVVDCSEVLYVVGVTVGGKCWWCGRNEIDRVEAGGGKQRQKKRHCVLNNSCVCNSLTLHEVIDHHKFLFLFENS